MAENSPTAPPLPNLPEFSVSEISLLLKRTLEERFDHVRVRGEISGFKRHSSGHLYLALKDADAVLDAVCWRGTAARLALRPEDGMEVICSGRITTYPGRSKYQLVIDSMELAGEGALLKLLDERRRRLAAEGLFDAARKRKLPYLPSVIGVVTSPTGAVIRDILHRLDDRFPRRVIIWPVAVQGTGAAEQVAAAIRGFNRLAPSGAIPRPDLLIVARGGGSLEDLWAFNEEIVVRAAAASEIPLIAAVGHETDTTLIDFAADRRAPTPTAAAEMAVPVRAELLAQLMEDGRRLLQAWQRMLDERRTRIDGLARGLPDPVRLLEQAGQRLDDWSERLANAASNLIARREERLRGLPDLRKCLRHLIDVKTHELIASAARLRKEPLLAEIARHGRDAARCAERLQPAAWRFLMRQAEKLDAVGRHLDSLSYHRVLARGYAVIHDRDGDVVATAAETSAGMPVAIEFRDGSVGAVVEGAPAAGPASKPHRNRGEKGRDKNRQGRLL
ncbi:MAG TPA: exodeoxyribonuclease VII large subunit [Alphaproteobacteria bacterium]|nr:exodeoxyribonuclease VII large subunit [Alphaproteobacteria bacterium]